MNQEKKYWFYDGCMDILLVENVNYICSQNFMESLDIVWKVDKLINDSKLVLLLQKRNIWSLKSTRRSPRKLRIERYLCHHHKMKF